MIMEDENIDNPQNPQNSGEIVDRDEKGRFKEGHIRLGGKEKGSKHNITLLEEVISKYETEKGKDLFYRFIERAFISDMVLLSIVKKFVADKTSTEITTPEPVEIIVKHVDKNIEEWYNIIKQLLRGLL